MGNLGTFSPQREAVRRVVDAAPFARNVTPFIAVYGEGDVDARFVIKNGFTPGEVVAEDIELRALPMFIYAEYFVVDLKSCRRRSRVEGIVDPQEGDLARGAGHLGQVHMFKF